MLAHVKFSDISFTSAFFAWRYGGFCTNAMFCRKEIGGKGSLVFINLFGKMKRKRGTKEMGL